MNVPRLLRYKAGRRESSRCIGRSVGAGRRLRRRFAKPVLPSSGTTLLLVHLLAFGSSTHASIPEDLNKLLDSAQYETAYVRAASQLEEQEGDPGFDFAYGQAALKTGRYLEAVFALERVVTLDPENLPARLALGQAYEGLGSFRDATKHYRSLLSHPETEEQASAALERVGAHSGMAGRSLRLWVDFSGGFDSNVNFGSGQDGIWINAPPFPASFFPFPATLQKQSARFHDTRLGADLIHTTAPNRAVDAYLSAGKKQNLGEDQFDQSQYALNTGYRFKTGPHVFRIAARYLQDDLNDKRLRYVWGLTGEYRAHGEHSPHRGWQKSLLLGISRMEYPKQRARNADQTLIGISGSRKVGKTRNRMRLFLGDEDVNGNSDYLGRRFASIGWRTEYLGMPGFSAWMRAHLEPVTGGFTPLIIAAVPFIELDFTHSRNRGEIPTVNERRLDRIFELKAGARTRISRQWEFRLELETRHADSNIGIYDHKRNLIRLGLRYEFE